MKKLDILYIALFCIFTVLSTHFIFKAEFFLGVVSFSIALIPMIFVLMNNQEYIFEKELERKLKEQEDLHEQRIAEYMAEHWPQCDGALTDDKGERYWLDLFIDDIVNAMKGK